MAWLLLALLISGTASAQILVVLSGEAPLYEHYMDGLRNELASTGQNEELVVRQERELNPGQKVEGYRTVVAVGVGAAQKVKSLEVGEAKVLYTLMPSATYRWLGAGDAKSARKSAFVLYLDQPLKRYLALIHEIINRQDVVIGLVYSSEAEAQYLRLREQSKGFTIKAFKVEESGEIITTLQQKMRDVDVLLALPDAKLFNSQSVQAVLLTTFRIKLPIVAFSDGFVQAGAIAGLVSKPEDIGRQTAEILGCLRSDCAGSESKEVWPKYFSVSVNKAVARRLGIEIPDTSKLVDQIKSMERTGGP
ncbi:MAG: hypothetical protein HY272_12215 [Gammaproteobacteria bacterium]|nr:hypothetical protein [Gammaproteobacteria bacterium]